MPGCWAPSAKPGRHEVLLCLCSETRARLGLLVASCRSPDVAQDPPPSPTANVRALSGGSERLLQTRVYFQFIALEEVSPEAELLPRSPSCQEYCAFGEFGGTAAQAEDSSSFIKYNSKLHIIKWQPKRSFIWTYLQQLRPLLSCGLQEWLHSVIVGECVGCMRGHQ